MQQPRRGTRKATLDSPQFKGAPALEACATRDAAHITPGSTGPHVRKIQDALNRVDDAIFRLQKPANDDARGRRLFGMGIGSNVGLPNPVQSTLHATQRLRRLAPVGLLDAANLPERSFQGTVTNVPVFRGRNVRAETKVSHYQRGGKKAIQSCRQSHLIWDSDLDREIHGEVRGFLSREWRVPDDYHEDSARSAHGYCCSRAEIDDSSTISRLLEEACQWAVEGVPPGRPRARPARASVT